MKLGKRLSLDHDGGHHTRRAKERQERHRRARKRNLNEAYGSVCTTEVITSVAAMSRRSNITSPM